MSFGFQVGGGVGLGRGVRARIVKVGVPKHLCSVMFAYLVFFEIVVFVALESTPTGCLDDFYQFPAHQPFNASRGGGLFLGHADSRQATFFVELGRALVELFGQ